MASHNAQRMAATAELHQSSLGVWILVKHLLDCFITCDKEPGSCLKGQRFT